MPNLYRKLKVSIVFKHCLKTMLFLGIPKKLYFYELVLLSVLFSFGYSLFFVQ